MKLSSRDIRIIEDVFASITSGETITRTAEVYRLGKHGTQALSTMLMTLERIGVAVPKRLTRGEQVKREWEAFRAWQAAQKATKTVPIVARANGSTQHHAD